MMDKDKIDFSGFLNEYLNDSKEGFQDINNALLALEKDHSRTERLDEIFRVVHTLKSSSTMLEFSNIAELAHICEDLLDRLRKNQLPLTQEIIDLLFEVIDELEMMVKHPNGDWGPAPLDRSLSNGDKIAELKDKIMGQQTEMAKGRKGEGANGQGDEHADSTAPRFSNASATPTIEKIRTVRVHVDLLDSLFNLVGELIITKNRIDNIVADKANKELKAALVAMDHIIRDMQENVTTARLVPVDEIFQKFPRMVRDLARTQQKKVELVIEGREIELDKAVLDAVSEPLIHLLINAVDHGIEAVEKPQKKKTATITLTAKRAENHIIVEVEDNGGGIDIALMKKLALRKGFVNSEELESLQDKDVLNLLFQPGFSSTEEVTGVSGRGVGLDVVQTSVKGLGGTVEVTTQKGQGTRFTLKLPLSTAIMQTLMVAVGEHVFAIPSDIVLETLKVKPEDIKEIRNEQALILRKEVIPFVKLNDVLNIPGREEQKEMIAVIIYKGEKFIGLGVDTMLDQMENIVKPFDPIAQQFKGFSGGTIMGDGRVALLLDIPRLLKIDD